MTPIEAELTEEVRPEVTERDDIYIRIDFIRYPADLLPKWELSDWETNRAKLVVDSNAIASDYVTIPGTLRAAYNAERAALVEDVIGWGDALVGAPDNLSAGAVKSLKTNLHEALANLDALDAKWDEDPEITELADDLLEKMHKQERTP